MRAALPGRQWVRIGLIGMTLVLSAALAACGGGGDGGGGGGATKLHVLLVNHTDAPANVTYSGGAPTGDSPAKPPIASCKSGQVDFPLVDPFTLSVNDKVVIDTSQLPQGVPNQGQSDVVVQLDLNKDGNVVDTISLRVGSKISPPSDNSICF
jgi:hypothetical protein